MLLEIPDMGNLKNINFVSNGKSTKFPLYITCVKNQPDTDFHCHEFVELVLIQNGSARHRLNCVETQIARGDVLVIPRGMHHGYINCCDLTLINILYIPEQLPMVQLDAVSLPSFDAFYKGLINDGSAPPFLHLNKSDFLQLENSALELYEENFQRRSGFQFNMLGIFMTILCRVMRLYNHDPKTAKKSDDLKEVIAFLHNNFRKKITLAQLCKTANMSRSSLMRSFSRTAGVAPLQYQLQLRISEAIQLLQMTHKSLGDIAFELGFSDSNYFGRQFKKITGYSPHEYRKNLWQQRSQTNRASTKE